MNGERGAGVSGDDHVGRGDRVLLMGLVVLLAVAASLTPIGSYDYWWHLATGRWILDHGTIPDADPFSFTSSGTEWVDHEWLFQILAYLTHSSLGPSALILLKIACVLALLPLFASHLGRSGHGPAGSSLILAVTLLGAWFRFQVRPEMATLVLVPLILHLALRARETGRLRPLLIIPPLCLLGANLHVGIILAPAFLLLGLIVQVLMRRFPRPLGMPDFRHGEGRVFERRLAAICVVAGACIAINPYGFRIYKVPFELSRLLASLPWPNLEWARPAPADFPLFYLTVIGVAVILITARRKLDPIATPALLVVGVLSLMHLRNIGLFFLLLPHGIGGPSRAAINSLRRSRVARLLPSGNRVRAGFVVAAVVVVIGIPLLAVLPPRVTWGFGIATGNQPSGPVDFLERHGVDGRLYNDIRFGGYLIWRRGPEKPVFIDGRNEVHADLLHDIAGALDNGGAWEDLLSRHRIEAALLRYPGVLQKVLYPREDGRPAAIGARAFSAAYFPKERWALVYWDDLTMVFLRRTGEHAALIDRFEYRSLHPDDWQHLLAEVAMGRAPLDPILAEIERKIQEDPDCRRARSLLHTFTGLRVGQATTGGGTRAPGTLK
jgi:hypothetical protein